MLYNFQMNEKVEHTQDFSVVSVKVNGFHIYQLYSVS